MVLYNLSKISEGYKSPDSWTLGVTDQALRNSTHLRFLSQRLCMYLHFVKHYLKGSGDLETEALRMHKRACPFHGIMNFSYDSCLSHPSPLCIILPLFLCPCSIFF